MATKTDNKIQALGLCECGCGGVPPVAVRSDRGNVKGELCRFIQGHNNSHHTRDIASGLKYCPSCDQILSKDRFGKNRAREDGVTPYCASCTNFCNQTNQAMRRGRFVEDINRLVVLELDDGVCGICHTDVDPFDYEVDHVIPVAMGGEHCYANVQTAHPSCNRSKGKSLEAVS